MMDEGRIIRGNWESKVHYEYAQYTAMNFNFLLFLFLILFKNSNLKYSGSHYKNGKIFTLFHTFLNSYLIAQ